MTEALATGRIVWGHPTKAKPKLHMDNGPQKGQPQIGKDGQPVMERSFGLAIPKLATLQQMQQQGQNVDLSTAFENAIWPAMAQEIQSGYPQGVPPRFSYKYNDGDGIDHEAKPFADREGYAGHIVLTISTVAGAPGLWKFNPTTGQYEQLTEDQVKCGDYVRVGINFKINVATGQNTPSIYVNPQAVEFLGYGKEISNGPNPSQLFGNRPAALPPGASATPVGGSGQTPPGMGGMPGQMPGQQQQPAMQPGYGQQMPGNGAPVQQMGAPVQQQTFAQQPGAYSAPPAGNGQQMQPGYGQQQMPPPAHDFVQNAGQPGGMAMPGQQPMQQQPGQMMMPGQMPPR